MEREDLMVNVLPSEMNCIFYDTILGLYGSLCILIFQTVHCEETESTLGKSFGKDLIIPVFNLCSST